MEAVRAFFIDESGRWNIILCIEVSSKGDSIVKKDNGDSRCRKMMPNIRK